MLIGTAFVLELAQFGSIWFLPATDIKTQIRIITENYLLPLWGPHLVCLFTVRLQPYTMTWNQRTEQIDNRLSDLETQYVWSCNDESSIVYTALFIVKLIKNSDIIPLGCRQKSVSFDLMTPLSSRYQSWLIVGVGCWGHMMAIVPGFLFAPATSNTLPCSSLLMKKYLPTKHAHESRSCVYTGRQPLIISRNARWQPHHNLGWV